MINHLHETATIVMIVCLVTTWPFVGVAGAADATGDAADPTLDDTDAEMLALSIDEPSDDEAAEDDSSDDEVVDAGAVDEEIAEEAAVDDDPVDDDVTDDELGDDDVTNDEPGDDEAEVATAADEDSEEDATTDDDAPDSTDENATNAADENTSNSETTTADPVDDIEDDDIEDDEIDDAESDAVENAEETVEDGANEGEGAVPPAADENESLEADQIEHDEADEGLDADVNGSEAKSDQSEDGATESDDGGGVPIAETNGSNEIDDVIEEVNNSEETVDEAIEEVNVSEEIVDAALEGDVNASEEIVDALEEGENESLENTELPEDEENVIDEVVDSIDLEASESEEESINLEEGTESDGLGESLEGITTDSVVDDSFDDGTNVRDETNVHDETNVSKVIEGAVTDLADTVRITDQNATVIERSADLALTHTIDYDLENTIESVNSTLESTAVDETTVTLTEPLDSLDEIELSGGTEVSSISVNADTDDGTLSIPSIESQIVDSATLDVETLDDDGVSVEIVTLDVEALDNDDVLVDRTTIDAEAHDDEDVLVDGATIAVDDRSADDGKDATAVSLDLDLALESADSIALAIDEPSVSSVDLPVVPTTDSTAVPVSDGIVSNDDAGGFSDPIDADAPFPYHAGLSGTDASPGSPSVDSQAEPTTDGTAPVPDTTPGVGPTDDDAPIPDADPEAGGGIPIPDESTGAGIVVAVAGVGVVARQLAKGSTVGVAADPSTVRLQARTFWETIRLEVRSLWETVWMRVHSLWVSIAALSSRLLWIAPIAGYSRYDDTDPLENDRRNRLYAVISREPGVNLTRLAADANISRSSSRHHLRILEYENVVVSAKVYGRRRFYPAGTVDVELAAVMAEASTRRVVEALGDHGPSSVSALADTLDRDPSTVTHHLKRLEEAGAIERERDGKAITNRLTANGEALVSARQPSRVDRTVTEHTAD